VEIANLHAAVDLLQVLKNDKPSFDPKPIKDALALNERRTANDPGLDLTGNAGQAVVTAIQQL